IIALAIIIVWGPSFQTGESLEPEAQDNILFVVDRTGSMNANDFADGKSRLDGVKNDIKKIITSYSDAQFSLVTFDSVALTQVPFTYDAQSVISYVNALTPQITKYSQGSKIDIGASEITDDLRNEKIRNSKAKNYLFFLSDGENTIGDDPNNPDLSAFDSAKSFIDGGFVIGYGSIDGSKMKPYNFNSQSNKIGKNQDVITDEYIKDPSNNGADAISKINPILLSNLAQKLGLNYIYSDGKENIATMLPQSNENAPNIFQRGITPIIKPVIWPYEILLALLALLEFFHFMKMRISIKGRKA
ncbi:MAG: VWA domain-containing protein, partial [Bifidobacteriaceae bacterium]|nr:VWA domain-containing protein [Bifidobacteriaceae bacterium]